MNNRETAVDVSRPIVHGSRAKPDAIVAHRPTMTAKDTHVAGAERALRLADEHSERASAAVRVAIFGSLLAAVIAAQSTTFDHRPLVAATVVYGTATLAGLVLAWRNVFRPWLPFVFVGIDIVTLTTAILLLGRMLALPPDLSMTLPVSGLVVIVFLHASMHYRPPLVFFAALLFAASIVLGVLLMAAPVDHGHPPMMQLADEHVLHFRIFPLATFVLAAVILLITTRRTRRFIVDAFAHAGRAATLSRYLSPEVTEELTSRRDDAATFGARASVAVLFADMRGFTAMAERMDPAELARFLSEFRSRIAQPVIRSGGVVDKYIGDAIMVVFGAPTTRVDDARRALACALDIVDEMRHWSAEREREGKPPVGVAVAGHCGSVFAGVLSDGRILEYTVIGDTVNVASRLGALCRRFGSPLVVSAALADAAGGLPAGRAWKRLAPQQLPGHADPVEVFQLA